jgi:phosphatidylglycerol:prolipoprotein diacylglycerol transferase
MRPVFFTLHLGSSEIGLRSYGLLIAAGLAVAIVMGAREARRRGMDVGRVLDFAFWAVVVGLVASRITYGLVNAGTFARACMGTDQLGGARPWSTVLWDCTRIVHLWEGGLVFYGGVLGGGLVALAFARREGWSLGALGDVFAPGLAAGHALGRLGCLAAGCCFGKEGGPWGMSFPRTSVAFEELASLGALPDGATATPPLHPTQLYEAVGEAAICALLLVLRPRLRARPGALVLTYLALYAALRFAVELFRGDVARRFVVELATPRLSALLGLPGAEPVLLSVGQVVSLLLLAACGVALVRRWRIGARPNA